MPSRARPIDITDQTERNRRAIEEWKNSFRCAACAVIKGGKSCAFANDEVINLQDIRSPSSTISSCDRLGLIPRPILEINRDSRTDELLQSGYHLKAQCLRTELSQLRQHGRRKTIESNKICKGIFSTSSDDDREKTTLFGLDCFRAHDKPLKPSKYMVSEKPETCEMRYFGESEEYMRTSKKLTECLPESKFSAEKCMSIEEMETYMRYYLTLK